MGKPKTWQPSGHFLWGSAADWRGISLRWGSKGDLRFCQSAALLGLHYCYFSELMSSVAVLNAPPPPNKHALLTSHRVARDRGAPLDRSFGPGWAFMMATINITTPTTTSQFAGLSIKPFLKFVSCWAPTEIWWQQQPAAGLQSALLDGIHQQHSVAGVCCGFECEYVDHFYTLTKHAHLSSRTACLQIEYMLYWYLFVLFCFCLYCHCFP